MPNENSSAPSSAATTTSRPVLSPPSTRSRTRAAQAALGQRLLRLGQPELPRQPGVLDRRQRARAGAAVGAGDVDDVGERLDHAGGDVPTPALGDELHRDRARGFTCFRSKMSCARSSIE